MNSVQRYSLARQIESLISAEFVRHLLACVETAPLDGVTPHSTQMREEFTLLPCLVFVFCVCRFQASVLVAFVFGPYKTLIMWRMAINTYQYKDTYVMSVKTAEKRLACAQHKRDRTYSITTPLTGTHRHWFVHIRSYIHTHKHTHNIFAHWLIARAGIYLYDGTAGWELKSNNSIRQHFD